MARAGTRSGSAVAKPAVGPNQPRDGGEDGGRAKKAKTKKTMDDSDAQTQSSSVECLLLSLPGEVLDQILGQPILEISEHLALAATCKLVRTCYYTRDEPLSSLDNGIGLPANESRLWEAILFLRCSPQLVWKTNDQTNVSLLPERNPAQDPSLIWKIWTNKDRVPLSEMIMTREWKERVSVKLPDRFDSTQNSWGFYERDMKDALRSSEWETALKFVWNERLSHTNAEKIYKLHERELCLLPSYRRQAPSGRTLGQPWGSKLYRRFAIERLAHRLQGGYKEGVSILWGEHPTEEEKEALEKRAEGLPPVRKGGARGMRT
ncbi:hypothetical protein T439DRAFT_329382 [Meredithblackwellia eburnea MCA 4105]